MADEQDDQGTPAATPYPGPPATAGDYTDAGVPTFDRVRDKIEGRWATALGEQELAGQSAAGRDLAEREAERAEAAAARLEELRRSVRGD